jgi:hypothetical protein
MNHIVRYLIALLILLSLKTAHSQELIWEWASLATSEVKGVSFEHLSSGYHNDLYVACSYDTMLVVGDTMLHHPQFYSGMNVNCATLKFNDKGDFQSLIDVHTIPGSLILYNYTGTDVYENTYIANTFVKRIFVQDTIINHCNSPFIDHPDIALIQLDKDQNINWAGTIGGTLSDQIRNFVVSKKGSVYMLSDHTASSTTPCSVDFFQQDTLFPDENVHALSCLDINGTLKWNHILYGMISGTWLNIGEDHKIYLMGSSKTDVIINQDTIIKPWNPDEYEEFLCILDTNGNLTFEFAEFYAQPRRIDVNESGDIFISGYASDTLIIGNDTTIIPQDKRYRFIGKFDNHFQPGWHHVIPVVSGQSLGIINIEADGDELVFSSWSNRNVQIADTILELHYDSEGFAGVFDKNGNLTDITVSNATGELGINYFTLDKCKDIIMAGGLKGKLSLPYDTVDASSVHFSDGVLIKIRRNEPFELNIGPDTTVCGAYMLSGPEGYSQYSLNGILSDESYFMIMETGNYVIGCSNEGCWSYDTIHIEVVPEMEFELGNDTTILVSDTLELSIPSAYDSIKWFDGTEGSSAVIFANDYEPGEYPVWVEVFEGPCSAADTLMLTIYDDADLEELDEMALQVFPNPFTNIITIESPAAIRKIMVINCGGLLLYEQDFQDHESVKRVHLNSLKDGVYMVQVITKEQKVLSTKMVKK